MLLIVSAAMALALHQSPPPQPLTRRAVLSTVEATALLTLTGAVRGETLEEFGILRDELNGRGTGSMTKLLSLLQANDIPEVVKLTKEYNGYLKGTVMASAGKKMDEDKRATAKDIANAVQEDLIAINKLVRADQQQRALGYYEDLKRDLQRFLDLA